MISIAYRNSGVEERLTLFGAIRVIRVQEASYLTDRCRNPAAVKGFSFRARTWSHRADG